jgi:hypothetical protein
MALPTEESTDRPYVAYRRRSWPWAAAGFALLLAAFAYTSSDLSELALQRVGQHVLTATWFGLAAGGGLLLLVATAVYMEYVGVDEAAIEHCRLTRQDVRLLWKDVDRIVLHKSSKRPKGVVEVRGPQGRAVFVDPRLARFDELEAAILERAGFFGIDVKSYR